MNVKQNFIHWYFEEFQFENLYTEMAITVEGSPWHREGNVGIHTDMVVAEYLSRSQPFDVRGAIACAFHDVGKPPAMVIKFRKDRGEYKAFHGHEQVSARMWENYACLYWKYLVEKFNLVPQDIYTIGWMIEHHVPWATKKDDKLNAFATTAYETVGHDNTWTDMLLADQYGRISDPSHQRGEEAAVWIADHDARKIEAEHRWVTWGDKFVYMLIGPSGSGKTRARAPLVAKYPNAPIVCMDDLRLEWYGKSYEEAWVKASKDSSFNAKVDKVYVEALRENDVVILDNTNTMTKPRRRWLAPARARDFKIVAILMPVDLQEILDRQKTREDKTVPVAAVTQMYNRMQLPLYGDFDEVIVDDGNLPT